MIKRQAGFTLVELLISMALLVLTIAAASSIFVPLLTQFKQQSKIAETQTQGMVGLEILRRDIEQAGFGLPWVIPDAVITGGTYIEAAGNTSPPIPPPNTYNDAPNPPRAILSDNDIAGLGNSDYLIIKSTSIATNDAAMKWTHVLGVVGGGNGAVRTWGASPEDLNTGDRVIVLIPSRGAVNQRILVNNGSTFFAQFNPAFPANFSPSTENDLYLIYGVDPNTNLRMPFNRADYYIRTVAGTNIPPRCAPGTGMLMKSVINHADGNRGAGIPLMDCVADFQVIFGLDNDNDGDFELGSGDGYSDDISGLTEQEIRNMVKEVRVYILSHEGQRDVNYTHSNATVTVGEFGAGSNFDFSTSGISNWRNYRWKVYRLVVKPNNMGS